MPPTRSHSIAPSHVLIVVNGIRGQQIVFCYPPPFNAAPSASSSAPPLSSESSGASTGDHTVVISSPPIDQLFGIHASALSSLLAPRKKLLVDRTLILAIDQLQFIALPTSIHERNCGEKSRGTPEASTNHGYTGDVDNSSSGGGGGDDDDDDDDGDVFKQIAAGQYFETEEEGLFGGSTQEGTANQSKTAQQQQQQQRSHLEDGGGSSDSNNEITDMCIVFVFDKKMDSHCKTNYERAFLLGQYSHLLVQVTTAYLREQRRCGYLNRELDLLSKCREQCQGGTWFDLAKRTIHERKSSMAIEMTNFVDSLKAGPLLQLRINNWINLCWRLGSDTDGLDDNDNDALLHYPTPSLSFMDQYQQHRRYSHPSSQSHFPFTSQRRSGTKDALSASSNNVFQMVRPHHACVHIRNLPKNIHFEFDGLEDIQRVWKKVSPVRNMQEIAKETNMSVGLVCSIASHLVDWGMIRILKSRLTNYSILALDPGGPFDILNLSPISPLSVDFEQAINDAFDLPSVLEGFSMARSYRSHFDSLLSNAVNKKQRRRLMRMTPSQHQELFINLIDWLLQHQLIEIRNTYILLLIPPVHKQSSHIFNTSTGVHRVHLSEYELNYIKSIASVSQESEDTGVFDIFRKLCIYFNGIVSVEEIIWVEQLPREELRMVINTFKDVLLVFDK